MLTYLALGDSYTIGEQVQLAESFPYQTVQLLRKNRIDIYAPEIIAKTGWTTDELATALDNTALFSNYDLVTLLVGVNNQYRGRRIEEFKIEFEELLKRAIGFAGGKTRNVFVFSIPDWGVTPFAKDRDIKKIAAETDKFNEACELIARQNRCLFIDITESQRKDNSAEMTASDGLHPSAKEYQKWAEKLAAAVISIHSAETSE